MTSIFRRAFILAGVAAVLCLSAIGEEPKAAPANACAVDQAKTAALQSHIAVLETRLQALEGLIKFYQLSGQADQQEAAAKAALDAAAKQEAAAKAAKGAGPVK